MILSLLLAGSTASATEPAVQIKKGEPAPFSGMLYPVDRAIAVTKKAERCDFLLVEEKERAAKLLKVQSELAIQKVAVANDACKLKIDTLQGAEISPWMVVLGYFGGVATVALGAWVSGQVSSN